MEIYAQKRDNLVRTFAARLRSLSEAEDLIQDLFFKVERLENQEIGENPSAQLDIVEAEQSTATWEGT